LVAAQETARLSPLTASEREFLDASEALDERERTEMAERAEQQARQNRRLQRLLVAVAVVLVVALAAGLLAFRQRNRANSESAAARAAQADAEQASAAAQASSEEATLQRTVAEDSQNEALALALAAQSTTQLANNQNALATLLAVESRRFAEQTTLGASSGVAHDSLLQAIGDDPTLVGFLDGQPGLASAMTFSPDGRRFATVDDAGALRVWDADTRRPAEVQPLPLPYVAGSLAMNNSLLAAPVNGQFTTRLWDVNRQELWRWQPPGFGGLAALPSNRLAVALSDAGLLARSFADLGEPNSFVEVWDTDTGTMVAGPIDVAGAVGAMEFSPDGERLAVTTASPDRLTFDLEILDVRTGASRWRSVAHPGSTNGVFDEELLLAQSWARFSADGTQISSVVSDSTVGAIVTLDAATGALVASNDVGRARTVMAISDDLAQLVLASGADEPNNPAEVVDARTGDVLASFPADVDPSKYRPMALRPDSTEVMVQSASGDVTVHDWTNLGPDGFVAAPPAELLGPDLATTSDGEVIDLSEPLQQLGLRGDLYRRWTASPSGQVAIATDATIDIWDPNRNEFVRQLKLPPNCEIISGIHLSFFGTGDDGSVIAECGSPVDTLKLTMWDLGSPSPDPYWAGEKLGSGMFIHSPDGSRLLDHDFAGLRLVTVAGGSEVARWPSIGRDPMVRAAYSPDGSVVAVVRTSGDVELLRADDLGLIRRLESSTGSVDDNGLPDGFPALAVSADNEYVAVWHWKLGVEIWNADSGESIAVLDGRRDYGPPAAGDTEASIELPLDGTDLTSARFPSVTLRFGDAGNGLDLSVIQGFQSEDGTRFSRRLATEWSLDDQDLIEAACGIVRRDLTEAEWAQYVGAGVPYRPTCSAA
jgi:WD40 repeat protein